MEKETTTQEILNGLQPLFERAEKEGLWFHCAYQDLWFSPSELKARQADGKFVWGFMNWTLKNPNEHIKRLERKIGDIEHEIKEFEKRIK